MLKVRESLRVREINCKTILNKSNLSDFTLNCYVGCSHRCIYCYARYMKKLKEISEDWGDFVDVKINAPEVLAQQIKKIKLPKEVYMSTVCDGWQPLEARYKLSRRCLEILLEAGFNVSILTKSSLVLRDSDILSAHKDSVSLGMTITTLDPKLKDTLEPHASEPMERLNIIRKAREKGIKTWVFLGPLIPEFTDTQANLESIFRTLKDFDLEHIYVDKLNLRWGVLDNLKKKLGEEEESSLRTLLYKCSNYAKYQKYSFQLKEKTLSLASKFSLSNKLIFCFNPLKNLPKSADLSPFSTAVSEKI